MSSSNQVTSSGGGSMFLLFLVFLVLKLTGVIGWSWWWVAAPLWGPITLVVAILLAILIGYALCELSIQICTHIIAHRAESKRKRLEKEAEDRAMTEEYLHTHRAGQ